MPRPVLSFALTLAVLLAGCPKPSNEITAASEPTDPPSTTTAASALEPERSETSDEGEAADDAPAAEPLPGQELLIVDRERSSVGFAVARATIGHIGHFARFNASLTVQEGQPIGLVITVRTGSVAADVHGLTEHLKGTDFFDVDKFPTATFTSESIEPLADEPVQQGDSTHRVRGTMHLHGVERKLDFPATLEVGTEQVEGSAVLDISAKAFGIDYEGMAAELAEDRVRLEIELVFPRVAAGRG